MAAYSILVYISCAMLVLQFYLVRLSHTPSRQSMHPVKVWVRSSCRDLPLNDRYVLDHVVARAQDGIVTDVLEAHINNSALLGFEMPPNGHRYLDSFKSLPLVDLLPADRRDDKQRSQSCIQDLTLHILFPSR